MHRLEEVLIGVIILAGLADILIALTLFCEIVWEDLIEPLRRFRNRRASGPRSNASAFPTLTHLLSHQYPAPRTGLTAPNSTEIHTNPAQPRISQTRQTVEAGTERQPGRHARRTPGGRRIERRCGDNRSRRLPSRRNKSRSGRFCGLRARSRARSRPRGEN